MLSLQSLVCASEGRAEDACRSLAAGLKLGRSLAKEPLGASRIAQVSLDASALRDLEATLCLVALGDACLRRLSCIVAVAANEPGCERALVGEAITADDCMRRVPADKALTSRLIGKGGTLFRVLCHVPGWRDMNRAEHLRTMREAIEFSRRRRKRTAGGPATRFRRRPMPRHCLLAERLLPTLGNGFKWEDRRLARLRAARAALAVERYRLKRGGLPASLQDLVPEYLKTVPLDPFDGKPLRFRKLGRGFMVYSVGPDGKDEGGRGREESLKHDDVSFRVDRDGAPKPAPATGNPK